MNKRTQEALTEFINQVQILAQGVAQMTGTADCLELLDAGEALKKALEKDETIV
jgi:hypothetical protein